MIHKIKILEQFADEIISGNKNFEIRKVTLSGLKLLMNMETD